ncbi:MAG: hypothetical protein FWF06_08645 [Symbiobacteriaceae bacterium]|nr:hypothetical protein [Symbiobacteriaceae bacterium]
MSKRLLSLVMVLSLVFSFALPVFAVTGVDHPDFNRGALREIVVEQTSSISKLVAGILPADTIKALAKSAISGLINLGDLSGLAGSALSGLLSDAIGGSLGIELPDSIDLGGIIDSVLQNDIVNSIITSDFVGKVIDRTIDNLIDAMVIEDVIGAISESVVDKLTDEIWNNGNPSSSAFLGIQTGHWNTTGGWNKTNIGLTNAAKLGISGITGGIEDYVDIGSINFADLFSLETIFGALTQAVTDTAIEYYNSYKEQLVALVQEKIETLKQELEAKLQELKEKAKEEIIKEINKIFNLALDLKLGLEELEDQLLAKLNNTKDYVLKNPEAVIAELKELRAKVLNLDKYSCLDLAKVTCFIDKLILCLESKIVPVTVVEVQVSAEVEKLKGNTNMLTITLVEIYSDNSAVAYKGVFEIDNNAIGTYKMAGGKYLVYVNTKGNIQIRDCYVVN